MQSARLSEWQMAMIFEKPHLDGYRIDVKGEPNVTLKLSFRPHDFTNFDIGTTTAMPATNAATAVVAAPSGVRLNRGGSGRHGAGRMRQTTL